MIILRSDELLQDYTLREIAECDTKAAILTSFDIINVGIAKSHTKHILATALEHIFNDQPALFANALPMAEQQLLSKLLCLQQNQHVEHPVNHRQHLLMQKLHLVLSYEAGDTWHIYMPDNIRKRLCQMAEADLLGPASTNARHTSPTTHHPPKAYFAPRYSQGTSPRPELPLRPGVHRFRQSRHSHHASQ